MTRDGQIDRHYAIASKLGARINLTGRAVGARRIVETRVRRDVCLRRRGQLDVPLRRRRVRDSQCNAGVCVIRVIESGEGAVVVGWRGDFGSEDAETPASSGVGVT